MSDLVVFAKLFCNDEDFITRIQYDMKHKKVLQELYLKFTYTIKDLKQRINILTGINYDDEENINSLIEQIDDIKNKKYNNDIQKSIINLIKDLIQVIEEMHYPEDKIAFALLLVELLDTKNCSILIRLYPKFKIVVDNKIRDFQNTCEINIKFATYMKQNYEIGKRYISISKNKKYYKNLLKNTIFSLYVFYSLYKKIKIKNNTTCNIF